MRFENFGGVLLKMGCSALAAAVLMVGSVAKADAVVTTTVKVGEVALAAELATKGSEVAAGTLSKAAFATAMETKVTAMAGSGAFTRFAAALSALLNRVRDEEAAEFLRDLAKSIEKFSIPLDKAITAVEEQSNSKADGIVELQKLVAFRDVNFSGTPAPKTPSAPAVPLARATTATKSILDTFRPIDADEEARVAALRDGETSDKAAEDEVKALAKALEVVKSGIAKACEGKTVCALKDKFQANMDGIIHHAVRLGIIAQPGFLRVLADILSGFGGKYDASLLAAAFNGSLGRGYQTVKADSAVARTSNKDLKAKGVNPLRAATTAHSVPESIMTHCVLNNNG